MQGCFYFFFPGNRNYRAYTITFALYLNILVSLNKQIKVSYVQHNLPQWWKHVLILNGSAFICLVQTSWGWQSQTV